MRLPVLQYPDPKLNTLAVPVTEFDEALKKLTSDMAETMYRLDAVGLAATQVDRHIRLIVIDVSKEQNQLIALVNPEVIESSEKNKLQEGCLSVPGIMAKLDRAEKIKVKAQNLEGGAFEFEAAGLLSLCVQHEIDHLNGKVFVQYLSPLKQAMIRKKLAKQRRAHNR